MKAKKSSTPVPLSHTKKKRGKIERGQLTATRQHVSASTELALPLLVLGNASWRPRDHWSLDCPSSQRAHASASARRMRILPRLFERNTDGRVRIRGTHCCIYIYASTGGQ